MTTYRLSGKNIEDLSDFLNICKEREIDFGKFVLTYGDIDLFVTAELEIGIPLSDLREFMQELLIEGKLKIDLGGAIYKNIDREIRMTESIRDLKPEDDGFLDEVEAQLGDFHRGLLVFVKVNRELENGWEGEFPHNFMGDLIKAIDFLDLFEEVPGMLEISDSLIQIFKQMMKDNDEYEDDKRDVGYIEKYSELVEEAIENEYSDKMDTFSREYSDLSEEFLEKLDVFIGENTFFRSTEKATL